MCFASNVSPSWIENGLYEGTHNSYSKPARPGSHWNVEERDLNGELFSQGQAAGALGWSLGDILSGESKSITIAIMFGHGDPVECSLEVDIEDVTDPNSFVPIGESYCGIDPLNSDSDYYTVDYAIDYSNPVTDTTADDYLGTLTDVVLTAELPIHIWPIGNDVTVYNSGSYNLIQRNITWDIGTLAPGASGTVYFTIKIMDTAIPGGEIVTSAKLSSEKGWVTDSESSPVCCYCDTVFVDAAAYGGYGSNGISWSHAYNSLNEALERIDSNACGDEIWIAKGTYSPLGSDPFNILSNVSIYGGFEGEASETSLEDRDIINNKTILSAGGNDYTINKSNGENIVLDGLTITGGQTAGIRLSTTDATINSCIVSGNGTSGLELASSSELTLTKSLVSDNGGDGINSAGSKFVIDQTMLRSNTENGIETSSTLADSSISNSIITANDNSGIEAKTGTIAIDVINCSIVSNLTRGAINENTTNIIDISNSILWDNGPIDDPNNSVPYNDKVQATGCDISYSCVHDPNDFAGTAQDADTPDQDGNITANPDFYFEPESFVYYLRTTSPCRDLGDNDSVNGTADYYSQSRILNNTVDMGAVEYDGTPTCEDCDFNDSAAVDFYDYLHFADSWLAEDTDTNYDIACDLSPDDVIDEADLKEFADCWLWEPDFIYTEDVMQIAHRDTGFTPLEPIETMSMMMSLPLVMELSLTEEESSRLQELPILEQVAVVDVAEIKMTGKKSKPLSVEAAEIAKTLALLESIYINPANMSEQDYLQYKEFCESLESTYYELISPK